MDKKKILVVDDELDMRIFISTVFETSGYEAVTARDGKDGLDKARKLTPDLIILDIMMPGEGGVLMYRHLKSDDKLKAIPVMMLSGVGKQTFFHYLKMMNVQPDDTIPEPEAYVEKPPNPDELLEIAASLLRPAA
jgi:CheY-like chemotaxis protein